MTLTIARLPNEPILIINFTLPLHENLPDIALVDAEARRIYEAQGDTIYSIVNLSDQAIEFSDILLFINEQSQGRSGSLLDIHMRLILVSTHAMIETAIKRIHQAFGITVAWFTTVDKAVAYTRAQIAAATPLDPDADPPSA